MREEEREREREREKERERERVREYLSVHCRLPKTQAVSIVKVGSVMVRVTVTLSPGCRVRVGGSTVTKTVSNTAEKVYSY
jgi:hypothetical protein